MSLLNEQAICAQLKDFNPLNIYLFSSIDSTNRFLKEQPVHTQKTTLGITDICCAETQTAGRGRLGRSWHSPFGENIYCSIRWHFNCDFSALSSVGLVVSLAIINALRIIGIDVLLHVKWPNDILWQHQKLSGILIEASSEEKSLIIGIGLNVNSKTKEHPLPDKAWCSLLDIVGKEVDRNLIIAQLVKEVSCYLNVLISKGFKAFLNEWQAVDYLLGSKISISTPVGVLHGSAQGVTEKGQLCLKDALGTVHCLSSGEASFRHDNLPF